MLGISKIAEIRKDKYKSEYIGKRTAYIINQIKRAEEFELFRNAYGEHYIQISCHADEDQRIKRLTKIISEDHPNVPKSPNWDIEARQLVNTDEEEEDVKQGQRVRQVFPLSDIVIDVNSKAASKTAIVRFFRALFGDNSVTPTKEEYGMELANTAAQRSSDLSRQVGAAILSPSMEIKALGCNEVPKAFGGTYWEEDPNDARDFTRGEDANHKRREAVLLDLVLRLKKIDALKNQYTTEQDIRNLLFNRNDKEISDSQLMDSLEYGRTVHAEMNAITDAARTGNAIGLCTLFSNTFPCHNCAKHIVASGLKEVVYIHPYPKSYAFELFDDSIDLNKQSKDQSKVSFRQFIGILGPMYSRVFTKARWVKEKQGRIKAFDKSQASYIRRTPVPAYFEIEMNIIKELQLRLEDKGYLNIPQQASLLD